MAVDLRGEPLLHHSIRAVGSVCEEVLVVGAPSGLTVALPDDLSAEPLVVLDADFHVGPLVALVDAARSASRDRLLVVAGDMPELQPAVLRHLLSWGDEFGGSCLSAGGWAQPFPMGLGREAAISTGEALTATGERSLRRLIESVPVEITPEEEWRILDPDARSLRDIDRPEDLEATS